MNRKDFLASLLGAIPIPVLASELHEYDLKGFLWLTDKVKLSLHSQKKWKDKIESEFKKLFFSAGISDISVIATYVQREERFSLNISRRSYVLDRRFNAYEA